jgi:hypothetical protein
VAIEDGAVGRSFSTDSLSWVAKTFTTYLPANTYNLRCWNAASPTLGEEARYDDISVLPLTLASLFSSVTDAKTSDVMVIGTSASYTAGTQHGVAARLDSPTAPTKGIIADWDGAGNLICTEFTAATVWNTLIAAVAKAWAVGDKLILDVVGNALRFYHQTAAGVSILVGTATPTANASTYHGLFSTFNGNSFSQFQVIAKGTNDGAWEALSSL